MLLTVFTPTYNRASTLPRLYQSLKRQQNTDFEWLIVDDGSTDETAALVSSMRAEQAVSIRYICQQNGGKHRAFNTGVAHAEGELFFCVDSDDFVTDTMVADIADAWHDIPEDVSGLLALKTDENGNLLCDRIPQGLTYETAYRLVNHQGCRGEFSFVFRTVLLEQHPFPEIKGERFVTESVLYDRLDTLYRLKLLDKVLTVCEYQADGLSHNTYAIMLNNPTGYQLYYAGRLDMAQTFKERIGYALRYQAFYQLAKAEKTYAYRGKHRVLVALVKPFGFLLKHYYLRKKGSTA